MKPEEAARTRIVDHLEQKVSETLVGGGEQSAKYRVDLPPGMRAARDPLPLTHETSGIETRAIGLLRGSIVRIGYRAQKECPRESPASMLYYRR